VAYILSLRLFRIVEKGDFELLRRAFPDQLERILNTLENFMISRTPENKDANPTFRTDRRCNRPGFENTSLRLRFSIWRP